MKLAHAVIAVGVAVCTGVGGGVAAAQLNNSDEPAPKAKATSTPRASGPKTTPSSTQSPSPTPTAPTTSAPTPRTTPSKPSVPAGDKLSDKNLVTSEVYREVTGNRITHADAGMFRLSACTGSRTFESLTASATDRIAQSFVNDAEGFTVEQIAQSGSVAKANESAELIIRAIDVCAGLEGGDFGYGDPVRVGVEGDNQVVYFPAFDSDKADVGGYIVFQAGNRIGYLDITDSITPDELGELGLKAMNLAAGR